MPNWCTHTWEFSGPNEDIQALHDVLTVKRETNSERLENARDFRQQTIKNYAVDEQAPPDASPWPGCAVMGN